MPTGPRIYNLFPLLVGPIENWAQHLSRIAGMGFDWIYLNPIHYSGFSGSLYAVKDPYRLDPRFQGNAQGDGDTLLRRFFQQAHEHGLSVMLDLVVNHTAKDALLVEQHPDWYRREDNGELYSPRAVDPVDTSLVTIWGDLAELDWHDTIHRADMVAYWSDCVRHYVGLGAKGFRCDAAYQVPADVWRSLIETARSVNPDVVFFAETLGCTVEQVQALCSAGFDFLFNSSKWWDFQADWLLDQYEQFRHIAPSVAFPESHDTDRAATEIGTADLDRLYRYLRQRYLFAAAFSTGVMIPMGFELGFTNRLNVVSTTQNDWEGERVNLQPFITAVNALKASIPAWNIEGIQRRITAPHTPVVGLLRFDEDQETCALILLNPDRERTFTVEAGELLAETGGLFDRFTDVTPVLPGENIHRHSLIPGEAIKLEPLGYHVFLGEKTAAITVPRPSHGGQAGTTLSGAAQQMREAQRNSGRTNRKRATQSAGDVLVSTTVETEAVADEALTDPSLMRLHQLAARRVAIENVWPEIDGGRFAVKREVGDLLEVWADVFADGHEKIAAHVAYKSPGDTEWSFEPMRFYENDRWTARVPLTRIGRWSYTIEAWRDAFTTWRTDFIKRRDAGQDLEVELLEGRRLLEDARMNATGEDLTAVERVEHRASNAMSRDELVALMLSDEVNALMHRVGPRLNVSRYERELEVYVDRTAARFSAWYELFPRSMSDDPSRHGTFDDVIAKLPYVREIGFDVLYFTPIHPIGQSKRKGKNNTLIAELGDPGSPYAIGSSAGGHTAIHPQLGTLDDFRRLVKAAHRNGLEIALDFAIQCSPDHPWISEHPEWFDWRPDGTVKYAENPPKKYEDIVNVHFYRQAMPSIWYALRDVVLFWVDQGVKIFRVDNPHTKPYPFWEWMIREVQDQHPDTIFLSEAFTRPKVMKRLAKLGFTQSYTYFTWRNYKHELTTYLTELTQDVPKEYMRPNFFANTPDINPPILQSGKRAAFQSRLVLAATLSPSYGIYSGYELCEGTPVLGKEEYLNSEKYELKAWDWDRPGNIRDYVTRINRIRRDNPALHELTNLRFHAAHDDNILFYSKMTPARDNIILIAVNLDPDRAHGTIIEVPLDQIGLPEGSHVQVEELLTGHRFVWTGRQQQIWLDPANTPAAIWRILPPGVV